MLWRCFRFKPSTWYSSACWTDFIYMYILYHQPPNLSNSPVRGQICAGWSKTESARSRCWYTIAQTNSSWSFQIQRCPGFPHSCRSLRHFKGRKGDKQTYSSVLRNQQIPSRHINWSNFNHNPSSTPEKRVWSEKRNPKRQLSKSQCFLNGFISFCWFDLHSFSILVQTMLIYAARHCMLGASSCYLSWSVFTRCM